MSDFKIGDKVYYFWHSNDCSLVWSLDDFGLEEDEITKFDIYGNPCLIGGYEFIEKNAFFKSKNEAIDAMIKHLEGIRDKQ